MNVQPFTAPRAFGTVRGNLASVVGEIDRIARDILRATGRRPSTIIASAALAESIRRVGFSDPLAPRVLIEEPATFQRPAGVIPPGFGLVATIAGIDVLEEIPEPAPLH